MSNEVITEVVEGGVLLITINRPKAKNAVNKAVAEGMAAALDELDGNADLTVGILTGADGTFCAGMDLKAFVSGEVPEIPGRGFAGLTQALPKKPLIAAIEGYALAGGMEIALCCDMIVAAETAKFGIPEVKRGLVAGGGGLIRLPRQIPERIAMELALTGDFLDATRAQKLGLINDVVPEGEALTAAKKLAAKIAANGPLAVAISKQVLLAQRDWSGSDCFEQQMKLLMPVFTSEDAIEGATAFAEKRPPVWKNR